MSTSAIPINFTENAARKVNQLILEEGNPELKLRVFITGGGCSGFQYGFTFDESVNPDDMVVEKTIAGENVSTEGDLLQMLEWSDLASKQTRQWLILLLLIMCRDTEEDSGGSGSVKLLIDPMSFAYLVGAKIDYREDINGAQFVISNPNAKTTCGCGSSFAA